MRHNSELRIAGFTMMEVMVSVVIAGILGSIAIPQYVKLTELSYRRQAQDILRTIYYGERAFQVANNTYTIPAAWTTINMENPNLGPVTFAVTAAAATTFTATATRNGGLCNGSILQIDQTRAITGGAPSWLACP